MSVPALPWTLVAPYWDATAPADQLRLLRWGLAQQGADPQVWAARLQDADAPDPATLPPGDYLTAEQVAAYWQVPRTRVYALVAAGHLPALRIGGSIRVARAILPTMASPAVAPTAASLPAPTAALMATCWDAFSPQEQWHLLAWWLADPTERTLTPVAQPEAALAPDAPAYWSVRDAARALAVSPSTIRRAIAEQTLPAVLVGTQWRIPIQAVTDVATRPAAEVAHA